MSRNARGRDPYVIHKERVELSGGNIALRIAGVCLALVIAVFAFGRGISGMLSVETGWQSISPNNPTTGITGDFTLGYNIGASGQPAMAELKAVSITYTEAIEYAYRVLCNVPMEHYTNLYTLNTHPNEAITVDPLLYSALETVAAAQSRYIYLAPVFEQYYSLCASQTDAEAEAYDPARNADAAEFAAAIAVFAADTAMVQLTLLPEYQVQLDVAEEYLRYAAENGVESYVDFGILLNAFLCDAAADALTERGYIGGILSCVDGYARVLGEDSFNKVLSWEGGTSFQTHLAAFQGPAALVTLSRFLPGGGYYAYADGTVRGPYLGTDGLARSGADQAVILDRTMGAAALALRAVQVFADGDFDAQNLPGDGWIVIQDGQMSQKGEEFQIF